MRTQLLAGLLTLTVFAGCSVDPDKSARVAEDDQVPFRLLDRAAPPIVSTTEPPGGGEPVTLYFVREGRLVPIERELDEGVTPQDVVAALAAPPTGEGVPARTALSDPLVVRDIAVVAGIARVDLAQSIAELGGGDQLLAVAQIVCTLTARPGVGQVAFTLEGSPIEVPRGDGSLVAHPVSRDDYTILFTS
ncbi:MAG TPA: GerMN domain-containing protein [Acidimicrobiales bacterium]|nr:GerMN domain-containing protein [Acidimicrobiales bacterium]